MFRTMAPYVSTAFSILVLIVGLIYAFGRQREKTVTKDECEKSQVGCNAVVGKKLDDLKDLVVELHEKQSKKIEDMDNKREKAKDIHNDEMKKIHKSMGEIKGHVEALIATRRLHDVGNSNL